jgi:large subunit ribosomal protein L10
MPMMRTEKELKIEEISAVFAKAEGVYLADLSGMNVEVVTRFRRACREKDVTVEVVKNTLLERAARGTQFEGLKPFLEGPTALMTSTTDAIAPARVLDQFIKANKLPKVKVACLEGTIYSEESVRDLSKLPTRTELIAMLARALNGPLTNLVSVLSANARNLARVLDEVSKKKGA